MDLLFKKRGKSKKKQGEGEKEEKKKRRDVVVADTYKFPPTESPMNSVEDHSMMMAKFLIGKKEGKIGAQLIIVWLQDLIKPGGVLVVSKKY